MTLELNSSEMDWLFEAMKSYRKTDFKYFDVDGLEEIDNILDKIKHQRDFEYGMLKALRLLTKTHDNENKI